METYTAPKGLLTNAQFAAQRQEALCRLDANGLDAPMVDIVSGFNALPYCFTLQSCFGHFVCPGQPESHYIDPKLHPDRIDRVTYRIAYIAFCVDNCEAGRSFITQLEQLPAIDPHNIQFCSANWFWQRQVNSYALQVEPDRFKAQDKATLTLTEARKIEAVRNTFYARLADLILNQRAYQDSPVAGADMSDIECDRLDT